LRSLVLNNFNCGKTVKEQNSKKILLVDDESGIRKILRLFLELENFEVLEAVSAAQAQEVIREHSPDVVILDVILGETSGFELCSWIKADDQFKNIYVILFTALNQEHDYKEGQRVGCDCYMTKPQNPRDIVDKVVELLGEKTAEKDDNQ